MCPAHGKGTLTDKEEEGVKILFGQKKKKKDKGNKLKSKTKGGVAK